ncbi:MAG: hypothetical protein DRP01_01615 [Archaeoglobales archaeon]|nr:MAG: hypothetical protein DRP01_01615 [Archaeoglobales archaeon]
MSKATLQIPPFFLKIDGELVEVLEILKSRLITGEEWYHVVVSIHYRGMRGKPYSLSVRSLKELENKLKIEITKLKMIEFAYGIEEVRRLIT